MTQAYSNPARASDPYALPDIEVFQITKRRPYRTESVPEMPGWYWWPCFPGCLPDSDPIGPFATEQEALDAAHDDSADLAEQHDDDRNNA